MGTDCMLITKSNEGIEVHHLDRYHVFYNRCDFTQDDEFDDFPFLDAFSSDRLKAVEWCDKILSLKIEDYDRQWIELVKSLLQNPEIKEFVLAHDNHPIYDDLINDNMTHKDFFY